jgi:hypothetical protein
VVTLTILCVNSDNTLSSKALFRLNGDIEGVPPWGRVTAAPAQVRVTLV